MSGTSSIGYTAATHDITTSAALFTNTSPSDAALWDYYPLSTGPQVAAGVNLSLTPDYAGNTVTSPPTIGHLQYVGLVSITTGTISPAGYCAGSSLSVPFTTVGTANAGNTFTAQLSNSSGSFASPVSIGTLSSTTSGTISATIPGGTTAGTGYYIRVTSSNPAITGSSYGPITVSTATPNTPGLMTGPTNACFYFSLPAANYSISPVTNATSYLWTLPTGASGTSSSTSIDVLFDPTFVSGTLIQVQAVSFCGTGPARTKAVSRLNPGTPPSITGPTTVCTSGSYSSSSTNSQSYTWTMTTGIHGSTSTSTPTNNFTFDPGFGSGTIGMRGVNGCASSSLRTLNITEGVGCKMFVGKNNPAVMTTALQKTNTIYPNPSNGNFKITLANGVSIGEIAIQIINETGELVYQSKQRNDNGVITVNLAGKLSKGVYTVSYNNHNEKVIEKLVITN